MDEFGNTREHKYSTAPCLTIDGVRAKPSQIKRIPLEEAAQRMKKKKVTNRRTVTDLTREIDFLYGLCSNIQKTHCTLARSVLNLYDREDSKRPRERDSYDKRDPKKGKGPMY
jgi:hypothetical protein